MKMIEKGKKKGYCTQCGKRNHNKEEIAYYICNKCDEDLGKPTSIWAFVCLILGLGLLLGAYELSTISFMMGLVLGAILILDVTRKNKW